MGDSFTMMAMGLGVGAGGLWVLAGVGIFLPVFHFVAMPHWGLPGHLRAFARGAALAAAAAVLPGGSLLAAWAMLAERRRRADATASARPSTAGI